MNINQRKFEEKIHKAFEENMENLPYGIYSCNKEVINHIFSLNNIPDIHEGQVVKVKKDSCYWTLFDSPVAVDFIKFVKNEEEEEADIVVLDIEVNLVNGEKHVLSVFDGWASDPFDCSPYVEYHCLKCNPRGIVIRNEYPINTYYATLFFEEAQEEENFIEVGRTPDGFWDKE